MRSSVASTPGTSTSASSGAPTPACWLPLHTLAALAASEGPLSSLLTSYTRYVASGEINSVVADQQAVLAALEAAYGSVAGAQLDHLDGLTVTTSDWWFNVRASNTEPLLRLNAEGKDTATMVQVRDTVLAQIRKDATP